MTDLPQQDSRADRPARVASARLRRPRHPRPRPPARRRSRRGGREPGAAAHRRAAVQGARRAQGRRHEVRPGHVDLRVRAAGVAGRAVPGHAHASCRTPRRRCRRRWCTRCSPASSAAAWRSDLVEFDDDPAAAASIGQVHHGRWRDGREVAVKIQYPGAGEALHERPATDQPSRTAVRRLDPRARHQTAGRGAPGAGGRRARLLARGRRADDSSPRRSSTTR